MMKNTIASAVNAIPIQPMMIPAFAMPRPVCVPPLASISRIALLPKMTARIEPIPAPMIARTSDAIAQPFVSTVCGRVCSERLLSSPARLSRRHRRRRVRRSG
jgi:hypothetical protein